MDKSRRSVLKKLLLLPPTIVSALFMTKVVSSTVSQAKEEGNIFPLKLKHSVLDELDKEYRTGRRKERVGESINWESGSTKVFDKVTSREFKLVISADETTGELEHYINNGQTQSGIRKYLRIERELWSEDERKKRLGSVQLRFTKETIYGTMPVPF